MVLNRLVQETAWPGVFEATSASSVREAAGVARAVELNNARACVLGLGVAKSPALTFI